MNHDRIHAFMLALLHGVAVARMILSEIAYPIRLPMVITNQNMDTFREAFARCIVLLEEEPLVSMVPDEAADLLRSGLGMLLLADEQLSFFAYLLGEDEGEKVQEWKVKAVEDLIASAVSLLHLAHQSLND